MVENVIKNDGSIEPFNPEKLNKWAQYTCKHGGDWSKISLKTFSQLPKTCTTSDIHQVMINVCYADETYESSKLAARLEIARLRKNMERVIGLTPNLDSFKDIRAKYIELGIWSEETIGEYSDKQEELYSEIKGVALDAWQIAQWSDKYLIKHNDVAVETPHLAAMGIGLGIHGDTEDGHNLARNIIHGKINLPTPILNGIRNGDFDGISCCVIEGGDSVESIGVAEHIAMRMTAKKAGIGIKYNTRTIGSGVKNDSTKHLGKHPIYKSLDGAVKMFTQISRGGSATVTFDVIDPQVQSIALWKSQRTDIDQRLDRLDYTFAFNDAFLEAVILRKPWYLFDYAKAPAVYENLHKGADEFNKIMLEHVEKGLYHTEIPALELLKSLLIIRQETGRLYCVNLTRMNEHTPFIDAIHLSNLCLEIALPTTPYENMNDLYNDSNKDIGGGETAFCSLAAIAPVNFTTDNFKKEYEEVALNVVNTVNVMITRAAAIAMSPNHTRTMLERMSLGIGITGLAGLLYKNGLDYDGSENSLEYVHDLAELHQYSLMKASIAAAENDGIHVKGIDTNWLPIDTKVSKYKPKLDWEALRGKNRRNSVLSCMQPCESSSLASGTTNGVYPVRQGIVYKKSNSGVVQYMCKPWLDGKFKTAYQVDLIDLSKYYGVIQDFTDQAISADTYFDPKQYEGEKKPMSALLREFIAHFRLGNKTMYYVNTRDDSGGGLQSVLQAEAETDCLTCTI